MTVALRRLQTQDMAWRRAGGEGQSLPPFGRIPWANSVPHVREIRSRGGLNPRE